MTNLMQTGAALLGTQLKSVAGRVVTIRQGSTTLSVTAASVLRQEHEVMDREGFMTRIESFDWTLVTADLEGLSIRAGAELSEADGSKYEVMPLGDMPPVVPSDTSNLLQIVHTKKVR